MTTARLFLYREPEIPWLRMADVGMHLLKNLGRMQISVRDEFVAHHLTGGARDSILSHFRVPDPEETPGPRPTRSGPFFDGPRLAARLAAMLAKGERGKTNLHLIPFPEALVRWDETASVHRAVDVVPAEVVLVSVAGLGKDGDWQSRRIFHDLVIGGVYQYFTGEKSCEDPRCFLHFGGDRLRMNSREWIACDRHRTMVRDRLHP